MIGDFDSCILKSNRKGAFSCCMFSGDGKIREERSGSMEPDGNEFVCPFLALCRDGFCRWQRPIIEEGKAER